MKNTIFVEVKNIGKNQKHKLFYQITSNMAHTEFNMNKTFGALNLFFFKRKKKKEKEKVTLKFKAIIERVIS